MKTLIIFNDPKGNIRVLGRFLGIRIKKVRFFFRLGQYFIIT